MLQVLATLFLIRQFIVLIRDLWLIIHKQMKGCADDVFSPDEVFAQRRERLFQIMSEHFEYDGLSLNVLHKRLGHFYRDLQQEPPT